MYFHCEVNIAMRKFPENYYYYYYYYYLLIESFSHQFQLAEFKSWIREYANAMIAVQKLIRLTEKEEV